MTQSLEMTLESNTAGQEYMEAMLAVRRASILADNGWAEPYAVMEFGLLKSAVTPDTVPDLSVDLLQSIARNAANGLKSKQLIEEARDRLTERQRVLAELSIEHSRKEVIVTVVDAHAADITEYRYGKWEESPMYAHGQFISNIADAHEGVNIRLQALRTTFWGISKASRNKEYVVKPRRSIFDAPGVSMQILDS